LIHGYVEILDTPGLIP